MSILTQAKKYCNYQLSQFSNQGFSLATWKKKTTDLLPWKSQQAPRSKRSGWSRFPYDASSSSLTPRSCCNCPTFWTSWPFIILLTKLTCESCVACWPGHTNRPLLSVRSAIPGSTWRSGIVITTDHDRPRHHDRPCPAHPSVSPPEPGWPISPVLTIEPVAPCCSLWPVFPVWPRGPIAPKFQKQVQAFKMIWKLYVIYCIMRQSHPTHQAVVNPYKFLIIFLRVKKIY